MVRIFFELPSPPLKSHYLWQCVQKWYVFRQAIESVPMLWKIDFRLYFFQNWPLKGYLHLCASILSWSRNNFYLRLGLYNIIFYHWMKIYGSYLVMKCFTINWASSSSSSGWITSLDHKIGNDSMEYQSIIISATTQFCEIPARVRRMIPIQFDGQWTHGRLHVDKWRLPVFWRNTGHLEKYNE